MVQVEQLLVWLGSGQRYGLPISRVERIVPMAQINPLPKSAPPMVGIINVEGEVRPVFRLGQDDRAPLRLRINQKLILARASVRPLALVADEILGLIEARPADFAAAQDLPRGMDEIVNVVRTPEGLVLVPHLENLLCNLAPGGAQP